MKYLQILLLLVALVGLYGCPTKETSDSAPAVEITEDNADKEADKLLSDIDSL